jgi:hypothetical protein
MKTILIPTDFSLDSTKVLDAVLCETPDESFRAIFLHAFKLSDSIADMLLLSRRSRDYEVVSDAFYEKLEQYKKNYYPQLSAVGIEYFYGSTVVAFKNFLEGQGVDTIAYDKAYQFKPINKYSIDPRYLTERVGCKIFEADTSGIYERERLLDSRIPEVQLQKSPV